MEPRIQNVEMLTSHGNMKGREAVLTILEAGLQATDPYNNTRQLIHLENNKLIIGNKKFEPSGDPQSGDEILDLSRIRHIYVIGAGKGIQRIAKAIEDILGDRLTGGHVIDKKGHPVILSKIGVTLGGHPVPDEDCVKGCRKILEVTNNLNENDLVFTCVSNGVSSLLTMPVPSVSLEDVRKTTYIMQVERGVPDPDLNAIRNHIDMMKGARISRCIQPAKAIHIVAVDSPTYDKIMHQNIFLHTLPECTTFQMAVDNLKKWQAWDDVPSSVRNFLTRADPEYETVKAAEFKKMPSRIFGIMPGYQGTIKFLPAMQKAEELGFKPVILAESVKYIEARDAGTYMASVCHAIERIGQPSEPPCALFTSGEVKVTVGAEKGIGGRNQEFALSAAQAITGSENIVIASVDTDGTDGPGIQFNKGPDDLPPCLAGGLVDGETIAEAKKIGINIVEEMKRHNSSSVLWKLKSGIMTTPNISLMDFTVALVMGRSQ